MMVWMVVMKSLLNYLPRWCQLEKSITCVKHNTIPTISYKKDDDADDDGEATVNGIE